MYLLTLEGLDRPDGSWGGKFMGEKDKVFRICMLQNI